MKRVGEVIDHYGSESQRRMARKRDREHGWKSLVDDPRWEPEVGVGGFLCLDAAGFRYYLPAAMARCLHEKDGWLNFERLSYALCLTATHELDRWTLLDGRQRRCVAAFLKHMKRFDETNGEYEPIGDWSKALESYWVRHLDREG